MADDSLHFIVWGTPVSHQMRGAALRAWKSKVAAAAMAHTPSPWSDNELGISITHFYRHPPRFDTDNMSKPICDALSNVVYYDDWQIVERVARRVSIYQLFPLGGMPRELALALLDGKEFVFIRVSKLRHVRMSPYGGRLSASWS